MCTLKIDNTHTITICLPMFKPWQSMQWMHTKKQRTTIKECHQTMSDRIYGIYYSTYTVE